MNINLFQYILILPLCLFIFPSIITAETVETNNIQLNSQSAILIEANSGQVLYEKNSQDKLPPASITKIATAIYAIEKGNLDDLVTVSEEARNVDGTRVYLEEGEQVPLIRLIQGLVINSGNDAGVAIAEHLGGSVDEFIIDFNQYLQEEIGVENTHFTNPHGLYDPEHVTTAEDMAKITQYAMKNDTFREIFNTAELPWDGETWDTTLINHHMMVRDQSYEGITGGKNGFVTEAGFTLVTTAERKNLSLIVVTLNTKSDEQSYEDTEALMDYGFHHFETEKIAENSQFEDELENHYVTNEDISFTKKIGELTEDEILSSGMLVIKGEDGRTIQEQKLTLVDTTEKNEQVDSKVVASPLPEEELNHEDHLSFLVPVALLITLFISSMFLLQVRRL
ncbi:hypothetical protein WQ54_03945 [Bacillus sp. SA1-12]|uniref:D-alanyl-D-alanine carboxypeptidase family protein n=1 Tax=Bacillus sp. SA1-12 TaxID=1455638 RepID=UPI0006267F9A|nr:D-alanyl-D-alanine carboxypeptidase family protein [Bacillus sp. SA1-12]KKI93398.1 hypothetical protein WQ54_03945 [Bacillus sp. SA1-12]